MNQQETREQTRRRLTTLAKRGVARQARLAPGGVPRWVRCYDNGGESIDRYTVVFTGNYIGRSPGGRTMYLAMNQAPFSPQGFGQHGEDRIEEGNKPGQWPPAIGRKGNLGTRIRFQDLPEDCQRLVWQDYASLWGIENPRYAKPGFYKHWPIE